MRENRAVIVVVAGQRLEPGQLVRRGPMNFGDAVPGWTVVPYELRIPADHLIAALTPVYEQFEREARADAANFPEDWPELAPAADAGYPPLTELPTRLPDYLASILRENLAVDLLDAVLPLLDSVPARYLANSVDDVTVEPTTVTVTGRALQVPEPRTP